MSSEPSTQSILPFLSCIEVPITALPDQSMIAGLLLARYGRLHADRVIWCCYYRNLLHVMGQVCITLRDETTCTQNVPH